MLSLVLGALLVAADPVTLPKAEAADGWIRLFDGQTTDGWKVDGEAKVADGCLVFGGSKPATIEMLAIEGTFVWDYFRTGNIASRWRVEGSKDHPWSTEFGFSGSDGWHTQELTFRQTTSETGITSTLKNKGEHGVVSMGPKPAKATITVPAGQTLKVRNVRFKPHNAKPIFNGKDLTGWKAFPGDKYKSTYAVTPEGWINVKNGPGDLQTTGKYDDFLLQCECISHGTHLNSGIFFRCLPDQYQQGYEVQIRNEFDAKTGKPIDFGTGAIYRRKEARQVVSKDGEWFTLTLLARGNRFRTWVDGYMTVDWTDERSPNDNARQGYRAGPGHLSIQGHDPTTNLSFRNLRIVELPR